jgi:ribosomal protein S18 acetylase RimI-like enzyme
MPGPEIRSLLAGQGGTMCVMVLVRAITADEWELMRDMRLSALADTPSAFGSTYAREAAFTEQQWRGRISERSAIFFAHDDPAVPAPAGLAAAYVEDGTAELVSMWVRPASRGRHVGSALVEAAVRWAAERDFGALFLWVTESNTAARRLYEGCGFTATGESQPLPSNPAVPEIRMRRPL